MSPDKPFRFIRGFMLDVPRLPEAPAYYRRFIDFCRDWQVNAIVLRLTDDQGCGIRFRSHPELLTHPDALSPDEARSLVDYAGERGVELIPEVESFGHSRCIWGAPEHAALADTDPAGNGAYGGLIPVHPKTRRILEDLYRETAAIFPCRYLHGGCDEVNWGGSEMSRQALRARSRSEIWADHLNRLNGIAQSLDRDLIVWGDHVLKHEPAILPLLDKRLIVMDWNYWDASRPGAEKAARAVLDAGLRVMGAPALIWCKWGPRPGAEQLANIAAYADAYRGLDAPGNLGLVITNWLPGRYLQNSIWDGLAFAAVAMNEGGAAAHAEAFERFVERHYSAPWSDAWADIYDSVYAMAPPRHGAVRLLPEPWATDETLREAAGARRPPDPAFARLLGQLAACEGSVLRNHDAFCSFRLAVEYLEHIHWRNRVLQRRGAGPADAAGAADVIRLIAGRDARMLKDIEEDWSRGRAMAPPPEAPAAFALTGHDHLLNTLRRAAAFSAALAADPDRFGRLRAAGGRP